MQDEILAKRFYTDTEIVPYYDLVDKDGNVVQTDVQVVLKNEIVQEGTPINKSTMLTDSTAQTIWGDDAPSDPKVNDALFAFSPPRLLSIYKTAGSYTWTVPNGVTKVFVAMIGGGGGGVTVDCEDVDDDHNASGWGACGCVASGAVSVEQNTSYPIVVGLGGAIDEDHNSEYSPTEGETGGSSTAFNLTAYGGGGFRIQDALYNYYGATGGRTCEYPDGNVSFGLSESGLRGRAGEYQDITYPIKSINNSLHYMSEILRIIPAEQAPFLMAVPPTDWGTSGIIERVKLPNGNYTASQARRYNTLAPTNLTTIKGTDPGTCGSVSAVEDTSTPNSIRKTILAQSGCDGCVAIYDITGRTL